MSKTLYAPVCLLLISGPAFAWGDTCQFSAERELDIPAGSATELALSVGAGELEVEGDPNIKQIQLRGRACASSQKLLDQLQLVSKSTTDGIEAAAKYPDHNGWGNSYASIDLVVKMPSRMKLALRDSSGDLSVRSVASVNVTDSSGDLKIFDIKGSVTVADSSGDIDVRDIRGDVLVSNDSSGDIEISDVDGNALVKVDSSGDIEMRNIRLDARVGGDSSGDITFHTIGGNATVESDGSGSIFANQIGADLQVGSDGSGRIQHQGVSGKVILPADR